MSVKLPLKFFQIKTQLKHLGSSEQTEEHSNNNNIPPELIPLERPVNSSFVDHCSKNKITQCEVAFMFMQRTPRANYFKRKLCIKWIQCVDFTFFCLIWRRFHRSISNTRWNCLAAANNQWILILSTYIHKRFILPRVKRWSKSFNYCLNN